MNDIFRQLDMKVDLDSLQADLDYILSLTDWSNNQITLQYADHQDWHCGNGKSDQLSADEQLYTNYHGDLDGRYIKQLLTGMPFPVAHARLMRLPPKTCYTTHVDYYTRYHVPITSRPLQTFMIFPDTQTPILRMYPGYVYWTNTHELHNFVNGTFVERIHLVFNNADEPKNIDNPYLKM